MKTINSYDEKERFPILRERALDVLRSQSNRMVDSSEKLNRVIHELQVHQIELELQNEELQRTQRALERSHSRYSDLYDRAPVGYFSLNKRGTIISANITGAGLLGVARETLIGQRLSQFIAGLQEFAWSINLSLSIQPITFKAKVNSTKKVIDVSKTITTSLDNF